LKGCLHVDEIVPKTEQDLEDILRSFKLDVRIVGDEYRKEFHGRTYCEELNCILMDGSPFSSSSLRKEVADKENNKGILEVCLSLTVYRLPKFVHR
jgi:glycerol-3-phosphate cytidylyltransferase